MGNGSIDPRRVLIELPSKFCRRDLAREIDVRFPGIPVLLITGYSASAQEAVHRGLVVLQKPYDLEALRRHIREAMESARPPQRVASAG